MRNVALLRLDQAGGPAPGNKSFKLSGYIAEAGRLGITRLVSFGGAWSNHLHALAATGHHLGLETIGIVRGEVRGAPSGEQSVDQRGARNYEHPHEESAMLRDARRWGMQLLHVSRDEYRQRNDADYQRQIAARFAPCVLIPEGGASALGAQGCSAIAAMLRRKAHWARTIVLPIGTGTTLAGLAANLDDGYELIGVSALKGATDLPDRIQALIAELTDSCATGLSPGLNTDPISGLAAVNHARWRILHDHHCGGFARVSTPLREFMLAFEAAQGIRIEPVYTGKMLFALHQLYQRGDWDPDVPVIAVHTGGLQGRRGYDWLG
ncbi:MAG: pyridoxal-phosphate dependent enzyme [Haliea sp.]|nr:pyridoxal-phosphate dependent enzyme [Haliea sp.]